jgi:hypothetical protein
LKEVPFHPDEVDDSFVEDYMSVAPGDEKSTMFADYLTNTYMTQESLFPPSLWDEVPSDSKRTTLFPCQLLKEVPFH